MATFRAGKFKDAIGAASFGLLIEGDQVGTFKKCGGISTKHDIITETKVKDGKVIVFKQPGQLKVGDITLERGYTDNMDIYAWRDLIVNGEVDKNRKNCTLLMYNQKDEPVAKWELFDCWPSELSGPDMDATSNDVAVEKLVLACERIERKKP
jgi:phage tail-like protein